MATTMSNNIIPVIPMPERSLTTIEIDSVQKARGQVAMILFDTSSRYRKECCEMAVDVCSRTKVDWTTQFSGEERDTRISALNFLIDAYQDFMQGKWQLP